jgi:hypothetical protein
MLAVFNAAAKVEAEVNVPVAVYVLCVPADVLIVITSPDATEPISVSVMMTFASVLAEPLIVPVSSAESYVNVPPVLTDVPD